MTRMSFVVVLPIFAFLGCSQPVIYTAGNGEWVPDRFDGAILDYYFARGLLTATAEISNNELTLSVEDKVVSVPDFEERYSLVYEHADLASDSVTIELDNGLLKKVSSTTEDLTVHAVTAANALLKEVVGLQQTMKRGSASPTKCKVTAVYDVTNKADEHEPSGCAEIEFTVVKRERALDIAGYPRSSDKIPPQRVCSAGAVCFRRTAAYRLKVTARAHGFSPATVFANVLAPNKSEIGFVRFDRRRFVKNETSIAFTNGMLSSFAAKDPSEVVGFFSLPTEILKGVTLSVQLAN